MDELINRFASGVRVNPSHAESLGVKPEMCRYGCGNVGLYYLYGNECEGWVCGWCMVKISECHWCGGKGGCRNIDLIPYGANCVCQDEMD